MKTIGTVLPTRKSLQCSEDYAARLSADRRKVAAKQLAGMVAKVVGGEVRYYSTPDRYAVVTHGLKVQWFEVRADGDYAVR